MKYRKYGRVYRLVKKNGFCIDCAFFNYGERCPVYDNDKAICGYNEDGASREMNYNFRETLFSKIRNWRRR